MQQELSYYQEFLDNFFEAIRTSDPYAVHRIIDLVRSGSSTSEIQTEVNLVLAAKHPFDLQHDFQKATCQSFLCVEI
jgi:hypothetical protein